MEKKKQYTKEEIASWPVGHKRCRTCQEVLPFSKFHKHSVALLGYSVECKECRKPASKAEWQNKPFEKSMLSSAKYRAAKKGIPFDLTLEDIVIPDVCPILGVKIIKERNHPYAPSLDQIMPGAGYTKDNIAVISRRANEIKNNITPREAIMLSEWLQENIDESLVHRHLMRWEFSS